MNSTIQQQIEKKEASKSADTVFGFVILGLLAAGGTGLLKAYGMSSGADVLLCLLASIASFSSVYYILFGRK